VLILKEVKVVCFDTLLQVLILKGLALHQNCAKCGPLPQTVFILKGGKVVCFGTVLEVLIPRELECTTIVQNEGIWRGYDSRPILISTWKNSALLPGKYSSTQSTAGQDEFPVGFCEERPTPLEPHLLVPTTPLPDSFRLADLRDKSVSRGQKLSWRAREER